MADALDRALTAGLADRARHLLAVAPVIAPDALAVLTELVACVDGDCSTPEKLDYWEKREAAAWDRARALVSAAADCNGTGNAGVPPSSGGRP